MDWLKVTQSIHRWSEGMNWVFWVQLHCSRPLRPTASTILTGDTHLLSILNQHCFIPVIPKHARAHWRVTGKGKRPLCKKHLSDYWVHWELTTWKRMCSDIIPREAEWKHHVSQLQPLLQLTRTVGFHKPPYGSEISTPAPGWLGFWEGWCWLKTWPGIALQLQRRCLSTNSCIGVW